MQFGKRKTLRIRLMETHKLDLKKTIDLQRVVASSNRKKEKNGFGLHFFELQNVVFKPFVETSAKVLTSLGTLEYQSNHTSRDSKQKLRKFTRITYTPKGIKNPCLKTHIMFEAYSNKSVIKVTEQSTEGSNTLVEHIGEYYLEQLDKDKIEILIVAFIKKVIRYSWDPILNDKTLSS
jgi:hypothetical protein